MKEFHKVNKIKALIYFFGLNIFLWWFLSHTKLLFTIFPVGIGRYIGFIIILLITVLIGWKDIKKYLFKIDNSWWKTIKIGIYSYASVILTLAITMIILLAFDNTEFMDKVSKDPMSIKKLVLEYWLVLPFNVISEEFYKLLAFLGLFSLLTFINNYKFRIIMTFIITSLAFGLLHSPNYNFMYAVVLGIATIPTYIFFIKYKSIYPLIIEHFLMNFINLGHSAEVNIIKYAMAGSMGILLLFSIVSVNIYIFKKLKNT